MNISRREEKRVSERDVLRGFAMPGLFILAGFLPEKKPLS